MRLILLLVATITALLATSVGTAAPDVDHDILVTFRNDGASTISGSIRAPYRARKRYRIAAEARQDADAIAKEFSLEEVDHWPIRSLGVYCFVYRVTTAGDRDSIIDQLRSDSRIESAQALQEFETGSSLVQNYNDTYARLQHGLDSLNVQEAHLLTQGDGVRIAIIDSAVDENHEDLRGQIRLIKEFSASDQPREDNHGTAVTSIIAANANNSIGIVGVAPAANIDLLISCWASSHHDGAVCDSFSLAKALDTLASDPPQIVNMSLSGPEDPLLGRLVDVLLSKDVIIVAADTSTDGQKTGFPASRPGVIGAMNAHQGQNQTPEAIQSVFAPGDQIMVAVPSNAYDFRSGSSLATAHVTGVVALLLSISPDTKPDAVMQLLRASQGDSASGITSVDACKIINLSKSGPRCTNVAAIVESEVNAGAQ